MQNSGLEAVSTCLESPESTPRTECVCHAADTGFGGGGVLSVYGPIRGAGGGGGGCCRILAQNVWEVIAAKIHAPYSMRGGGGGGCCEMLRIIT